MRKLICAFCALALASTTALAAVSYEFDEIGVWVELPDEIITASRYDLDGGAMFGATQEQFDEYMEYNNTYIYGEGDDGVSLFYLEVHDDIFSGSDMDKIKEYYAFDAIGDVYEFEGGYMSYGFLTETTFNHSFYALDYFYNYYTDEGETGFLCRDYILFENGKMYIFGFTFEKPEPEADVQALAVKTMESARISGGIGGISGGQAEQSSDVDIEIITSVVTFALMLFVLIFVSSKKRKKSALPWVRKTNPAHCPDSATVPMGENECRFEGGRHANDEVKRTDVRRRTAQTGAPRRTASHQKTTEDKWLEEYKDRNNFN